MGSISVRSVKQTEWIDLTAEVERFVEASGISNGLCHAYCSHTTAGLTINEHADPDVARDVCEALDGMVPLDISWRHAEGNSPAHVKATLVGASVSIPVRAGKLGLGTWQGVFLCEFDGPRTRRIELCVFS